MSAREWKPGDVAKSEHAGISVVADRCDKHFAKGPHWHHMDGGWDQLDDALSRGKFRPLVVIDAEDREAVERLRESLERMSFCPWACGAADCITAALREFANPKPREVYRHFVESDSGDGQLASKCGKVWRPDPAVSVIADCPECTALVRDGWSA